MYERNRYLTICEYGSIITLQDIIYYWSSDSVIDIHLCAIWSEHSIERENLKLHCIICEEITNILYIDVIIPIRK